MTDEEIFRNRSELLTKALKERDANLEDCGQKIFELNRQIIALQEENNNLRLERDAAVAFKIAYSRELANTTIQRDEARKELCAIMSGKHGKSSYESPDAVEQSRIRGWDCFKDESQHFDKYDGVLPGDLGTDRP